MKVSITKAARLADVSRTTLYNDMNSGKLTYVTSGKNKKVIDVAELERVYGSLNIDTEKEVSNSVKVEQKSTVGERSTSVGLVELAVLRERLDTLEAERKREREQFEERIEHLQSSLDKAQENQGKTTLLLEHYTKEGRGADWEKALSALEDRISNQEKSIKEDAEKTQKLLKQKKALEEALKAERSKGFFERLFG